MEFKIDTAIFYRRYNNKTVVYNTSKRKIYFFNGIVKDMLDCFKEYCSIENCINKLEKTFGVLEPNNKKSICEFLDDLIKKEFFVEKNILKEIKNSMEDQIRNSIISEEQLYNVQFELTFRCQERCRYCYCVSDSGEGELTTCEIKKILDDIYEMGVFQVTFTGGDLFMRKDVFEILEYAYKKNFLINIFTNGLAISDTILIQLYKLHLRSIHFSIYSHIPEKHDYWTQVPGSFEKTVSVIKKCVALGIPVNIKTCVLDFNEDDIEEILRMAENLGTTIQISMSVSAKNNGDMSPTEYRLNTPERYAKIMKIANKHIQIHCSNDYSIIRNDEDKICGAGYSGININPFGKVYPCNSLLIECGDVKKESIKDIWKNSKKLIEIRKYRMSDVKGCENCLESKYCHFCPGSALTETGSPLLKYSEACNLIQAKKILKGGINNDSI